MTTPDEPAADMERSARPCPICGKPQAAQWRPFCSRRCADIDLHRWLKGGYAIPASDEDEEEPTEPMPRPGEAV